MSDSLVVKKINDLKQNVRLPCGKPCVAPVVERHETGRWQPSVTVLKGDVLSPYPLLGLSYFDVPGRWLVGGPPHLNYLLTTNLTLKPRGQ